MFEGTGKLVEPLFKCVMNTHFMHQIHQKTRLHFENEKYLRFTFFQNLPIHRLQNC